MKISDKILQNKLNINPAVEYFKVYVGFHTLKVEKETCTYKNQIYQWGMCHPFLYQCFL